MAVSDAQKKASMEYAKRNLKRIPLDVQKEKYEEIVTAAELTGKSINGFIKEAINEKLEKLPIL